MAVDNPANPSLAKQLGEVQIGARNDLEISRHVFFGETSYVVRDPVTFQGHSFSPSDYEIFTNLDECRTLDEVFKSLVERNIVQSEDEESYYQFIVELQKQSLLSLPITDGDSLYQQFEQRKKQRSKNLLLKLLFLKVPLGCPDRFLRSTYHHVQGLFTRTFFVVWLAGFVAAIGLIGFHWSEFTSDLSSVLAIGNLPMILVVMSLLKIWHELGHGYACRHFGVAVPSAGLLFMVGTPLAFMDASGSWSLPNRNQRQIINLAGMYFEMMIAIVAAFVWVLADSSSIKSIAHFTLLVSSVTTVGFNINPLMKYDGYYVLADWLGIPNLKSRATFAVQSFFKRVFFGIKMPPTDSNSLRAILVVYGMAAALYRVTLVLGISLMISLQIWIVGVLLGGYYLLSSFGSMFVRLVKYLAWSEDVREHRLLAVSYLLLLIVGLPAALLCCPVPGRAQARGVAEYETIDVVHVKDGGFLHKLNVHDGQLVSRGAALGEIEDLLGNARRLKQQALLASLEVKYRYQRELDSVKSAKTEQKIEQLKYELSLAKSHSPIHTISAPVAGRVVASTGSLSNGQYLEAGTELLKIGTEDWVVYAVANADSFANIKPAVGKQVHCRFIAKPGTVFSGTIQSVSAAGSRIVRYEALTHLAGGFIPVNPDSMEATEPFFELMIKLDEHPDRGVLRNGIVCEVRFRKSHQTLAELVYRSLIRLNNQINLK